MESVFTLHRRWRTGESTIGCLMIGDRLVYTLEDTFRPHKVWGETRIPAGLYPLNLRDGGGMNARYRKRFPEMHRGMIWLRHVPDFEWIYIHPGNTAGDTLGCILVGLSRGPDRVAQSVAAYQAIYPLLVNAIREGSAWLEVRDEQE